MRKFKSSAKIILLVIICILTILVYAVPAFSYGTYYGYIGQGEKYNVQTSYEYIDSTRHKVIQSGQIRYPIYDYYNGEWHFRGYLSDEDSFRTENYVSHDINQRTGRCRDCGYQIRNHSWHEWNGNWYYW